MICEQCGAARATVYAIDRVPGGWGGYYCRPCQEALQFKVVDTLATHVQARQKALQSLWQQYPDGVTTSPDA